LDKPFTYTGAPSFAYAVGGCIIDREGTLLLPPGVSHVNLDRILTGLKEHGYEPEDLDAEDAPDFHSLQLTEREELGLGRERRDYPGEDGMQASDVPEPDADDSNDLVIEIPLDGFTDKAIENLGEIVASKNQLFKKAFGTDSTRIDTTDESLLFPWFTLTGSDGEADAYMHFVCALCEMAKTQQRVTAKEKDSGNDKFTMRLFLIRLGFVGPEYKTARKILLRNLAGNTAWKDGKPKREEDEINV